MIFFLAHPPLFGETERKSHSTPESSITGTTIQEEEGPITGVDDWWEEGEEEKQITREDIVSEIEPLKENPSSEDQTASIR